MPSCAVLRTLSAPQRNRRKAALWRHKVSAEHADSMKKFRVRLPRALPATTLRVLGSV
jgi:hypothetical protein